MRGRSACAILLIRSARKGCIVLIREISLMFNQCASVYERDAQIAREIGERLIERLDYFKLEPHYILDLGCAAGVFSKALRKRYPKAVVVSVDLAWLMAKACKQQQRFRKRWPVVCADMHHLPFANKQFDLIFMNQVLQWSSSIDTVLQEIYRVLRPQGCYMFSMLGPDTYKELNAFIDPSMHAPLIDMHHVGDAMINAGFDDPVLDMEMLTVRYRRFETLCDALKTQGVMISSSAQTRSFLPENDRYPVTFEVIYGHGWRVMDKQKTVAGETFIPLDSIVRKSNS